MHESGPLCQAMSIASQMEDGTLLECLSCHSIHIEWDLDPMMWL